MLILDEPTNHLDIESREALEDALRAFPGAVLLVSHDRALLDAVGTRTVAVEEGTLRSYDGGWAEYVRVREERDSRRRRPEGRMRPLRGAAHAPPQARPHAALPESPHAATRQEAQEQGEARRGPSKNRLNAQQKAEQAVEAAEAALAQLEQELTDPAAWATRYEAAKSEARHTAAKRAVDAAYAELEALVD